jgi:hypothetical protein
MLYARGMVVGREKRCTGTMRGCQRPSAKALQTCLLWLAGVALGMAAGCSEDEPVWVDPVEDLERWPGIEVDSPPLDLVSDLPEVAESPFTFLAANIGNVDVFRCATMAFNLCGIESEDAFAETVARLRPDIVALSEVPTPAQCAALGEVEPWHICHPDHIAAHGGEQEAVRRMLGDGYTIACNVGAGFECVGARVGRAAIAGCAEGALCRDGARTSPTPDGCDDGFSVSAVSAEVADLTLDVVNVHPKSGNSDADAECRLGVLRPAFEDDHPDPIRALPMTLVGGDFNFDPYSQDPERADVAWWNGLVGGVFGDPERPFWYHSGIAEHNPPYPTLFGTLVLDHVVSNALTGTCVTLGAAPGTAPADRDAGDNIAERFDHRALYCLLGLP